MALKLELSGDTAVVIGGAQGIGLAIAREFAREQCRVELLDVSDRVETTAKSIAAETGKAANGRIVDVTNFATLKGIAKQICSQATGALHLVCAAGCGSGKYGFPFWNLQPEEWGRVLEVNLLGAVHAAHAFVPHFTQQRQGTMLFFASVAAQMGSQTDPPYSAAKAGLINFAHCAAKDLAPYNVRVNTISPGMVATAVNRSVWRAWHDQQSAADQMDYETWAGDKVKRVAPLGRWQTCEDIAAMAVFLASPRASNITGQTLNIDGGQVMHS